MKLNGKVALVTGSSSGVGAAIAKGMASEGADVVVNYNSNREGADETVGAILRMGRQAVPVQADVGMAASVAGLFHTIRDRFGRLDVLVNNAGITLKKPFTLSTEQEWDRVHSTNLKSVFLCTKEAVPLMARGGAVLNISSAHAKATTHNFSVYAASKAGMEGLTRSMAIELGEKGIRVNALRLGLINVARAHVTEDDVNYAGMCARIPVGRPGDGADVVPVAVLLCSDDAAFITGQVTVVDGGSGATLNTLFARGHVDGGARNA